MDITLLLKGFSVGFVVAIPIGPVGLLCTQRTLSHGRMHGLISGLGAATADVIYASIAAFGLSIVSNFLIEQKMWFRLFGGVFLGSMFWWITLGTLVGVFHKRVGDETLVLLARIFGSIIASIGVIVFISSLL